LIAAAVSRYQILSGSAPVHDPEDTFAASDLVGLRQQSVPPDAQQDPDNKNDRSADSDIRALRQLGAVYKASQ
jgi:hypothetical protein